MLDIQLCAASVLGDTLAGRTLSTAFEDGFRKHPALSPGERAVVREICYERLRSLGLLEAQLGKLLLTPVRHAGLRASCSGGWRSCSSPGPSPTRSWATRCARPSGWASPRPAAW